MLCTCYHFVQLVGASVVALPLEMQTQKTQCILALLDRHYEPFINMKTKFTIRYNLLSEANLYVATTEFQKDTFPLCIHM